MAQLASEYQVMKLKIESDEVIWRQLKNHLTACKQLNGFGLHIDTTVDFFKFVKRMEPLGLIKSTNLCVQILSEVKLQTRKDALKALNISEENKRQITDLGFEKLDMFEQDTVYFISILGRNLPKYAIRGQFCFCSLNERLRTLRLAYFYCGHSTDVYADCLKKIKEDFKEKEMYLSDESFLIMPERVKDDIETVLSYALNGRV
ncbi:hypothetical protein DPMN_013833 [Dreissena polymorpha]|uniref:Uncharacterized protein n=1 Tax=Dreissena polymorpha TaxID=45954 RepID=A0A9D4S410_DREPO|nr:hypothetical protein DPMN_013833 [Dreissena polymorpha]